jgi:adenylate cyclase
MQCGSQNRAGNVYCENCGEPLGVKCDTCGHFNSPTSRFCGRCRAALSTGFETSTRRILQSLREKGGERKQLTVLFADIRNSTSIIDSLGDPEIGMRRLEPVLELMKGAVHRFEGVVNKVQGDGVMALFGAPRPLEDHAVRGCLAALAMQEALARLNDPNLRIRVGVHTGEVIVQTLENTIYQTYDAAGVNVHIANRLEQLADEGGILISEATYAAAKQFIEAISLGRQNIRGVAAAVEIYRLVGLRHAPSSGVFRSGGRLSPLTGRKNELAALEVELSNTIRGEGRVVGIVGEAGIGKSRICFEFADACRHRGVRVYEARVLAHGRATPLQPVLELLRDIFGIRTKEAVDVLRGRVTDRAAALSLPESVLHLLLEFLGISDSTRPTVKLDPKTRKTLLLELVRTLARSSDVVTVVLIEDLHWIDEASEEFVEVLSDAVVGTQTLLVVNFRPGFAAPFMHRSHYRQIGLHPLTLDQSEQLLQSQLGDDSSLALLSRNMVERAQGNPFFLEELVKTLVERGELEGERGAYRLRGGSDAIPVPTTVQAVVAARIDHLADPTKNVLETAAVIGRVVSLKILEDVSSLPNVELLEAVGQLRRAELLYDVPPYDQGTLSFRHPLIQEVAYRSLLIERRRQIHGAVARAMEHAYKERGPEYAGLIAYHLEQAGEKLRAAQQNVQSAIWVGTNDPREALRTWKKVRELLLDQPETPTTIYLRMLASGQIVNFGWREGIPAEDAGIYYEEAKRIAISLGDTRANALINAAYGRILANGGSADEYVERIREAMTIADAGKDVSVQITLKAVLCHALRLSGRMSEALQMNIEAMERSQEIVKFDRQTLGFDIEVWLTAMRGQTLVMLGRGDEARPFLDRILQMDGRQVDAIHYVIPSLAYVDLAWADGDVTLAQQHADRAFSLAAESGNPYLRVYAQACRGLCHAIAGRGSAAIEDLSKALSFARSRKAGLENEPRILADLAHVYLQIGDTASAASIISEASEVATARHARIAECLARIVRAELLLRSQTGDQQAEGVLELERASALIEETGARIFEPVLNSAKQVKEERQAASRRTVI